MAEIISLHDKIVAVQVQVRFASVGKVLSSQVKLSKIDRSHEFSSGVKTSKSMEGRVRVQALEFTQMLSGRATSYNARATERDEDNVVSGVRQGVSLMRTIRVEIGTPPAPSFTPTTYVSKFTKGEMQSSTSEVGEQRRYEEGGALESQKTLHTPLPTPASPSPTRTDDEPPPPSTSPISHRRPNHRSEEGGARTIEKCPLVAQGGGGEGTGNENGIRRLERRRQWVNPLTLLHIPYSSASSSRPASPSRAEARNITRAGHPRLLLPPPDSPEALQPHPTPHTPQLTSYHDVWTTPAFVFPSLAQLQPMTSARRSFPTRKQISFKAASTLPPLRDHNDDLPSTSPPSRSHTSQRQMDSQP
ncbi:hypothetical protein R3P38DRAFT_2794101 [Favolaschia claudopus]|uniref:Uncharacterized protein n=1 Tax=Favolaschia claudopus TaxID=2862362 RepID=A0AAW0AAY8_9AGAR